ncbi:peroxisomal biogenesis factor 11 [Hyaloraphidium curvatum]|nr:peroxisomal biogenesis factor 11 [Hyaloraphidium curvatum]
MSNKTVLAQLLGAPKPELERFNKVTATTNGIDKMFMTYTFGARLINWYLNKTGNPELTKQVSALSASLNDARFALRLPGSLPVIAGLVRLENSPPADAVALNLRRAQLACMLVYFFSEHLAWLGGKGVIKMEPARAGQHALRSVRAMLGNLLIGFLILYQERQGIIARESQALTVTDSAERQKGLGKLRDEKAGWTMRFINNAALTPIFFHMSRPDLGLLSDVQIGILGLISAYVQLSGAFAAAA